METLDDTATRALAQWRSKNEKLYGMQTGTHKPIIPRTQKKKIEGEGATS